MALIKAIENEGGITLNYWKIGQVDVNWINKTASIAVMGYVSEEARLAGKKHLNTICFYLTQEESEWEGMSLKFDFNPAGDLRAQIYERLKTTNNLFEGAEDA